MKIEVLLTASRGIVARNITARTIAATVDWNPEMAKLELTYIIDGQVTDEDEEFCELALTELLAEFPDIALADSRCRRMDEEHAKVTGREFLVFQRNDAG